MDQADQDTSKVKAAGKYINRDVSDLAYVGRILEQAQSTTTPLAERLRFIGISNLVLDEFVAVRFDKVAKAHRATIQQGTEKLRSMQFDALLQVLELLAPCGMTMQAAAFSHTNVVPTDLANRFADEVMPAVTPSTVDREHPFPILRSQQLGLLISVKSKARVSQRVVIPLPSSLGRLHSSADPDAELVTTETLIAGCIDQLLPKAVVEEIALFRVIRANDIKMAEEFSDLRSEVERRVGTRSENPIVCIEVSDSASAALCEFLTDHLFRNRPGFLCPCPYPGIAPFDELQTRVDERLRQIDAAEAFYPTPVRHQPQVLKQFHGDWFAAMHHGDFMLHWPYDDFAAQIEWLRQAGTDPDVIAIKQTLYRTDEAIVESLIAAAGNGKEVTVILELEARENEQENVAMSRRLERAGARVVYGIIDLKIHAKLLLVVRKEQGGLREYANFATGNYHTRNARQYSDLSLFTARRALGRDLTRLFNYITGNLAATDTTELIIAPTEMRAHLLRNIQRETENARQGKPSGIWLKLNSLLDKTMVDALYSAAQAGVPINAFIRRHCALRPGPGIQVKSLIGRYLEHARALCFANGNSLPGPQADVYIGSADWMPRNFDQRVEVLVPVLDERLRMQLMNDYFGANFRDTQQSWIMQPSGKYLREKPTGFCAQSYFAATPLFEPP